MDSTLAPNQAVDAARAQSTAGWLSGRQGRRVREALLAYAFLVPTILIVGTFGLFPLLFAAYESTLTGLSKIVGRYDGLGNYVKAIDSLAYVLGFGMTIVLVFFAVRGLATGRRQAIETKQHFWPWLLPGIVLGTAVSLVAVYIFRLLPILLEIPNQMRGEANRREVFQQLLGEALRQPQILQTFWLTVGVFAVGLVLTYLFQRLFGVRHTSQNALGAWMGATVMLVTACVLGWLTWAEIQKAYAEALEEGVGLDLWAQIITISAGFVLLLLSWWIWQSASERQSNTSTFLRLSAAAILMLGAWVLIGELPRIISAGDEDWWMGLLNTVYYSAGTIPLQLIIALVLATLLFQDIIGKSFFRIIYFLPYIAPFVGTAAVFRILFSGRANAPVNSLLTSLGLDSLQWLNEPAGIWQLLLGDSVQLPGWAVGPSLALVVIIIYGTWTFIGFNTVIFMAGLGNIPRELYEAAAIDGAGRWSQFRNITLPLLSPTMYFLTLYSVIGTFKAFNHIYVLRSAAALGTTDTASIIIFEAFKRDTRYGYASALAILLLIIILGITAVNNRIASRRVFYG